jgi:predicted PurR-regulated permease PerM
MGEAPAPAEELTLADDKPGGEPAPPRSPARVDVHSFMLTGLFLLALLYTLYAARVFIVPLIVAVLLSLLFKPSVRRLRRAHIPEAVSAALILAMLLATVGAGLYSVSGPASEWLAQAPAAARKAERQLRGLLDPLHKVSQTAEQVEALADGPADETVKVEIRGPRLTEVLFGGTQNVAGGALVVVVLLYFLLASGDMFLAKLIKFLPRRADKKRAVLIARQAEEQISSYLATITAMNALFGVAVGLAMYLLGMPNPVLWGVLAGLTNYVPYVGALFMAVVLGVVALLQSESVSHAGVVTGVFLVLNFLEGYLLTPKLLGRRLALNPVVVFTGVLFWGWVWGIIGALLAVPILATFKIVCDHSEQLAPVGEFLGE